MKKCIIALLVICFASCDIFAQSSRRSVVSNRTNSFTQHLDSIRSSFGSSLGAMATQSLNVSNTSNVSLSPYMYKLMGQGTYFSSTVRNQFGINWNDNSGNETETSDMKYRDEVNQGVDDLLASVYVAYPRHFTHYDTQFVDEAIISSATGSEAKPDQLGEIFETATAIQDVTEIVDDIDVELKVTKPNFWKTTGKFGLQFTQNYLSQKWYKGGNNNVTNLATLFLTANYNDQKLVQWDNSLDLRLGFMSAPGDTCHSFLTNNDKINLNSKVGVKATKSSWYYTFSMQAYSQFLPGYRSNDRKRYSAFLAPLDVNASLGMDFKPKLKKPGCSLSVALLPLSYKLRYIGSDDDQYTIHKSYNMKNDDGMWITTKHDFGSRLEYNSNFKLLDNLTWKCRLYYYTTYKYVEGELENMLSFSFNKYFSTDLYTLWRYDDNRSPDMKDSTLGYFQFKEYITIGLAYSF